MPKTTYRCPGITCGHCVNSIRLELAEMEGVVSVQGDAEAKTVAVEYNSPATDAAIRALLTEIGYAPAG